MNVNYKFYQGFKAANRNQILCIPDILEMYVLYHWWKYCKQNGNE